jgi:hypothetical protein
MTVALSQDSAGNTYQIWAQEQPDSCAIASMWMARCQAKQQTFVEVSDSTPAVVLLGWYYMVNGALQRNGGHFVVAVNVLGNRIVYLDPWGGVLNEFGNNTRYDTNGYIEEIIYVSAA